MPRRRPPAVQRKLNSTTRRRQGLLSTAESGLTADEVAALVRAGHYRRIRRGVVVLDGAPPTWEQTVQAVTTSAGPGVLAALFTAARLLGCRVPQDEVIHVLSSRPRRVRMPGVQAHRSLHLFDEDTIVRHGVPCTSAARTLVDLSARLDDRALGKMADDLQRRDLLRLADLRRCVGRLGPAPGRSMKRMHALLAARWPGYEPGDSDLETKGLRALVAAGLPIPRQQHRIKHQGRRRYFDLAWPEIQLAVEIDSDRYHAQAGAQREDRIKGNDAAALGWTLVRLHESMGDEEMVSAVLPVYQRLSAASA